MWHLMWLTTLCLVCCLSTVNRVVAAPVDSDYKAAEYLKRFGYLERGPQDSSYSESVKAESFIDAIKDFQSFAGLKKTGKLDRATKELMNKPRCGVADRIRPSSSSTRRKRFVIEGSHWPKKQLTYKIKKYTPDMSPSDVDREIARAFQMWADVTDLTFVHVNNTSADVDIDILFASGEHGSCPSFNDGPGGTLAHATYPIYGGDAHFDDGETWTLDSVKGTNLFQVATHEFGHSLGLNHTNVTTAVMYPYYVKYQPDFKLDMDDIEGIQELYDGNNQFSRKLALELKATVELLRKTVNNLEKKNIELRDDILDLTTKLNARTGEIVDIGKMPTSCGDLNQMGQKVNGFFLVKGSKKMETLYCDFNANQNDKQKWIGYADVKSTPVIFYVQRNSDFKTRNHTPVPFDLAWVNEGNAMDLTSGKFTAPRPGIYFFSFAGVARLKSLSDVYFISYLRLNGEIIGASDVTEYKGPVHQMSPLTLQSTLNLKTGDQLWLTIEYNDYYDSSDSSSYLTDSWISHRTHFTGFMLEEEIVASL